MKKLTKFTLLLWTALLIFCCAPVQAGLQIPYTPDANTLHLWHFNDSTNQVNGFNTVTDAVDVDSITLTNFGQSTSGNAPFTNIFLVTNGATAALKDCLSILPDNGNPAPGSSDAFCGLGTTITNSFPDTTEFRNPNSGAFTFEALVNIQGNIFSGTAGNGEWEVFCGDNDGSGGLTRGWQFRLQNSSTAPAVNCNFIDATGGSSVSFTANLPVGTGLDPLATNQWYHVAVTYTGNTPTNNDPIGVMTFYWTLLDPNRTNADVLQSFTNAAAGTLGGTPIPAIGGSSRNTKGVGNAGSFQGFIDEVRVSSIARQPNDMIFTTNAVVNPPTFVGGSEPPANTIVGFGKPLSVSTLVKGTLPIFYQWQKTNITSGGYTNVPLQTNNSFDLGAVTFNDAGFYRLIATNAATSANTVTSTVAQVTVGASISELYGTGFDTNGVVDTNLAALPDPHYTLVTSADINDLGPNALVWNMAQYPIAADGGAFSNPDGGSQWIGPVSNNGGAGYTSPQGGYVYRTTVLLDSVDTTQPVSLQGTWWGNTEDTDILLNGVSTGNINPNINLPIDGSGFSITSGFVPGLNTLDFVVTNVNPNGSYLESALRVEMTSGLGQALPAGKPDIIAQPAGQTVADGSINPNSVATFSVVALARPPITYQWVADNNPIVGATNRTLSYIGATSNAAPGTNFTCVVSNGSGSVTSSNAVLTLVGADQPPVLVNYSFVVYTNETLTFNLDAAYEAAVEPDHDLLGVPTFDGTSANGGSIVQNGIDLVYTPTPGYVGPDEFNYYIPDSIGTLSSGAINLTIVPPLAPTTFAGTALDGNIVLHGAGGSAGGSFHVLSSTNITTPLTNWVPAGSGVFGAGGSFSITNATTLPQNFYIIEVP